MNIDYGEFFSAMGSLLFALWPLMFISQLRTRKPKNIIPNMLIVWGLIAVFRVLLFVTSFPLLTLFIPEPLNTIVFFLIGPILFGIKFARDGFYRRDIQHKADTANSVEALRTMSPKEFEDMVVELYKALGHNAKRTGATGDHGVDVVVQTNTGEKWVVQAKRWRGSVGEPIVRDFYGVVQHEKADKGAIITTGKFTMQARDWAKGKPITLVEGEEFLNLIHRARGVGKASPQPVTQFAKTAPAESSPLCPKCGSQMILRIAKRGGFTGEQFWGCSTYPKCSGKEQYNSAR
jgi:hypothetical protein